MRQSEDSVVGANTTMADSVHVHVLHGSHRWLLVPTLASRVHYSSSTATSTAHPLCITYSGLTLVSSSTHTPLLDIVSSSPCTKHRALRVSVAAQSSHATFSP